MIISRKIELLAPAKNLECGIEAINHGADAVYIGAPQFSARSAAGNTIADIEALTDYAHQFGAKVHVAFNTILRDDELKAAESLIWDLYRAGVDAIIIQDMGIAMLNLPPIPLHASTQNDNRTVEKVKFMEQAGFSQVVLARELDVETIRDISSEVKVPLEVFVHGALCVCYSGQCYLSEAITHRSANRGACAQFCRLPYDLQDSSGEIIQNSKHLLSMKDLNLSDHLEELLDAGASSLKIEGRLKDVSYVKNVVAYYRLKLDEILERRPEFVRASSGKSTYTFQPDLNKSFNRGYTKYFFHGRSESVWSLDSPKSIGEPIGKVKSVFDRFFVLSGSNILNNGDGICFLNEKKELEGLHINRVEGENIFPAEKFRLKKGTFIYRNFDHEFEKILSKKTAERKIEVNLVMRELSFGYSIEAMDEDGCSVILNFDQEKEKAHKPQSESLKNNLSKTGGSIFAVSSVLLEFSENWFIPASLVSEWRRQVIEQLLIVRKLRFRQETINFKATTHSFPTTEITYLGNVLNDKSKQFYVLHQSKVLEPAFEKKSKADVPLMFTKHCIKQSLGWCPKENREKTPYSEPYYLRYKETTLRLVFDCKACEMHVLKI